MVKLEFYRRAVTPYEGRKVDENGDIPQYAAADQALQDYKELVEVFDIVNRVEPPDDPDLE